MIAAAPVESQFGNGNVCIGSFILLMLPTFLFIERIMNVDSIGYY